MRLPLTLPWRALLAAGLLCPIYVAGAAADTDMVGRSPILGRWLTEDNGGVIELAACGDAVCGRIVGMRTPRLSNGTQPVDSAGRPQCGLTILRDGRPDSAGQWNGRITDPRDGSVWRCVLWLDGAETLHLRGYVLIQALGQTQTWHRFGGTIGADCHIQ